MSVVFVFVDDVCVCNQLFVWAHVYVCALVYVLFWTMLVGLRVPLCASRVCMPVYVRVRACLGMRACVQCVRVCECMSCVCVPCVRIKRVC